MKKNLFVFLSLAAVTAAASTAAYAASDGYTDAGTGITGSRHDINAFAKKVTGIGVVGDNQERVCAFCHSPHHAYTEAMMTGAYKADYLPLWSHELTQQTYNAYASDTLQAVIGDPLIGPSRLCMSCHDGVVAVDTHYTNLGEVKTGAELKEDLFSADPVKSGAVGALGNLAGDHPIGFDYIAAQSADFQAGGKLAAGIRDADANYFLADGGNTAIKIRDTLYAYDNGEKKYMTCSTCHEVHNRDNVRQKFSPAKGSGDMIVDGVTINYFLYGSQAGSQICLSCHDK